MNTVPAWRPTPFANLYDQLADHLAARIEAGEYEPGDRLPPERDIALEYEVSMSTVRPALDQLRKRGLTITRHGRGTFVAERQKDR